MQSQSIVIDQTLSTLSLSHKHKIHIRGYTGAHMHTHTHTHTHTCIHTRTHMHAHTCIHTRIHTCTHTHALMHLHSRTHAYRRMHKYTHMTHTCSEDNVDKLLLLFFNSVKCSAVDHAQPIGACACERSILMGAFTCMHTFVICFVLFSF